MTWEYYKQLHTYSPSWPDGFLFQVFAAPESPRCKPLYFKVSCADSTILSASIQNPLAYKVSLPGYLLRDQQK